MEGLLEVADTERLSWEREAVVLYLGARASEDKEIPRRLVARLRTLLREATTPQAAIVAGMAAAIVRDPEVERVAGDGLQVVGWSSRHVVESSCRRNAVAAKRVIVDRSHSLSHSLTVAQTTLEAWPHDDSTTRRLEGDDPTTRRPEKGVTGQWIEYSSLKQLFSPTSPRGPGQP